MKRRQLLGHGPLHLLAQHGTALVPYALVLLFGLGLPLYLRRHLDLSDVPGPAGVKLVAFLSGGTLRIPLLDPIVPPLLALAGGNGVALAFGLSLCGGAMACIGAALGGHALAGRLGALASGLIAAFFSYGLLLSTLTGPDPIAWGLSWLGLGLVFFGARLEWAGLPLVIVGCLLTLIGPEVKENALPTLPLLLVAPLVATKRPVYAGLLGLLGAGTIFLLPDLLREVHLLPHLPPMGTQSRAAPEVGRILEGLGVVKGMVGVGWWASPFFHLFVLGTLGALVPGQKHLARLGLWVGGLGIFGLVGIALGTWTKTRFLLLPAFPYFLLAGTLFGIVIPRMGRGGALGLVALGGCLTFFWFDTLDLFHQWSVDRGMLTGTADATLPRSPNPWRARDHIRRGLMVTDFGATGSVELVRLARSGPEGGVLGVRMRDSREAHLVGAAAVAGLPHLILTPEGCCPDHRESQACADAVVEKADGAGARLILPRFQAQDQRLPPGPPRSWALSLAQAAGDRLTPGGTYWWVMDGQGGGPVGVLPCTEGPGAIQIGLSGAPGGQTGPLTPRGPPLPADGRAPQTGQGATGPDGSPPGAPGSGGPSEARDNDPG